MQPSAPGAWHGLRGVRAWPGRRHPALLAVDAVEGSFCILRSAVVREGALVGS